MLRAYADSRYRCYNHPHRSGTHSCRRCSTRMCDECVQAYGGAEYCANCVAELELIEASKPTRRDHVFAAVRSLRNLAIGLVIVGILAIPAYFVFRNVANQKISPEEWARFRYAAAGTFNTPEGINVNSTVLGAKIVHFTSERPGFEASHLINEYTLDNYPGWRSQTATFPQEIVVETQNVTAIQKVILVQQGAEPKDTWTKDIEVLVSTQGPNAGFKSVGRFQLTQTTALQRFTFPSTPARWIMLRILSNYGSTSYTSLDEFDAYVVSATPTPVAR